MVTSTTVKERPILFSGPMVRAILDGRKTQTRRVIKAPDQLELDDEDLFCFSHAPDCGGYCDYACAAHGEVVDGHIGWTPWGSHPKHTGRLWVREMWQPARLENGDPTTIYKADFDRHGTSHAYPRWRPSIHMPRSASRLTLEITDVRVQRLSQINWLDAVAEGFGPGPGDHHVDSPQTDADREACIGAFMATWDKLNGPRGYPVSSDPWVWALTFKVVS